MPCTWISYNMACLTLQRVQANRDLLTTYLLRAHNVRAGRRREAALPLIPLPAEHAHDRHGTRDLYNSDDDGESGEV